jgi:hypothetical protein
MILSIVPLSFYFLLSKDSLYLLILNTHIKWACQLLLVVKNPPANAGDLRDMGSIRRSGRFPGGSLGN